MFRRKKKNFFQKWMEDIRKKQAARRKKKRREKRKKSFLRLIESDFKKFQKRTRKEINKVFNRSLKNKKRFRKMMKEGPMFMEGAVNVIFILIVFVLFWKKARNPEFLSDFGATKL